MKPNSIDLGLAISAHHCTLGAPKTAAEIAAYCGCSRQRLEQIEKKALRKLRATLYRDKKLREELETFFK